MPQGVQQPFVLGEIHIPPGEVLAGDRQVPRLAEAAQPVAEKHHGHAGGDALSTLHTY